MFVADRVSIRRVGRQAEVARHSVYGLLTLFLLGCFAARVDAAPIDALGGGPVLGGMPFSTSGPESEPGSEEYVHIRSTDVWDPNRFWYTERPNLINQDVPENWDAMKVINTDRPDFTDVATVVGPGVTQIETGYTFTHSYDRETRVGANSLPESLLRYGTSDRFEWRMKWFGYLNTRTESLSTGVTNTQEGLSDLQLGFKWIAITQDDWRPLQTIVTRFTAPLGSQNFSSNNVQPGITYIYNWQVRRWWFIRGSSGADWLTNPSIQVFGTPAAFSTSVARDYTIQGFQSLSSYFQISQRLGMFVELYMLYFAKGANDRPQYFHDYGLYGYITPNLQLDIRIGQRIDHQVNEYFTGAGISTRF